MLTFSSVIVVILLLSRDTHGQICVELPKENVCKGLYNNTLFSTVQARSAADGKWDFYLTKLFPNCVAGSSNVIAFACLVLYRQCDGNRFVPGRMPCRDFCRQITTAECENVFEGNDHLFSTIFEPFDCSQYNETQMDCISYVSSEREDLVEQISRLNDVDRGDTNPPTPVSIDNCTLSKLQEGYFSEGERTFAKAWIAVWSTLCAISTVLTVITFCLDRSRFQYPWRPIIYLSISFTVLSVSYFLVLALGPKLIVRPLQNNFYVATRAEWEWAHAPCILTFTLLYYTQFASAMWWVVLTLCWFLAAGLKWGNEAIAQLAPFYHVLAWSVPLILTISLMAAKVIGGDDLTGACFVVRDHNSESFYGLLFGYILPMIVIVLVGCTFMVIGFLGIIRVRSHFIKGGEETGSLDKLIIRMGIFNIIYLIPAIIVIGCTIYELVDQVYWCPNLSESTYCSPCHRAASGVFITRILFSLVVGILSGMWIWSKKTLMSWKTAFGRCFKPVQGGSAGLDAGPTTTSLTEEDHQVVAAAQCDLDRKVSINVEMQSFSGQ